MNGPIHVAIDARPLSRNSSGIKRYLECLLENFLNSDRFIFSLYSDGPLNPLYQQGIARVNLRTTPGKLSLSNQLWQYHVNRWLDNDSPDVYFSPRHHLPLLIKKTVPAVVTIHDVIWKTHPQTMRTAGLLNEIIKMPHAIRRADRLICPSMATAGKVTEYWPRYESKIRVISHGSTRFSQNAGPAALTKPYFLAVGTIEPRKNLPSLIEAFDRWAQTNSSHDLVIVGNRAWGWQKFCEALERCTHKQRIHHFEGVDDQTLSGYYRNAAGFIQISLEEGFGMPVAEARQFGLPQILSDIPVFRELNVGGIAWARPTDVESIQQCLDRLKSMGPLNPENLLPPWSDVSEKTLAVFAELFNTKHKHSDRHRGQP